MFEPVIQIAACPVPHRRPQHDADRPVREPWPPIVTGSRWEALGRIGRAEEGLCRPHVVRLAKRGVDQVVIPVKGPVKVGSATTDLQVGLLDIPADPQSTPAAVPALAELVARDRQQLCVPVAPINLLRSLIVANLSPP